MNKWTRRYLDIAKEVATWSKDPSRQIGAIAVGDKGQILSQGYNGFPRGVKDTDNRYNNREEKYKYVVHGEMNCIYNAFTRSIVYRQDVLINEDISFTCKFSRQRIALYN